MTTHTAIVSYYASADLDDESLLCHRTTDATVKTASATGEINAGGGRYSAVFEDVAAGTYVLKLLSSGVVVATRVVEFAGTNNEIVDAEAAVLNTATISKIDSIKSTTDKIDTGLVLDGVVWQFTVNMLEAAIIDLPKYGDIQRHAQEAYNTTSKTVDVTVTKVT